MMSQGFCGLVWETLQSVDYNHILLLFFLSFRFLLFPPNFFPDEFSVTTRRIVLKFGDMIDMDVKLCNRVLKFKCRTLRLANRRAQTAQTLSRLFLTNHSWDLSILFSYDDYNVSPLERSGDIFFYPLRPSVRTSVCLSACPSQNRVRSIT